MQDSLLHMIKTQRFFKIAIFLLFLSVALSGILRHELWADEAHHWLLARDSKSIGDLIHNMRYDGHPMLWNILLFFVTSFTHNPLSMQLLHLVISSLAIFIFIHCAPFSRPQKSLFIFGYFSLFEYTVISRNYALVLLFFFLILTLYSKREKSFIWMGVTIAALSNTHLFGLIIALSFMVVLAFDFFRQQVSQTLRTKRVIGLLIALFGVGLSPAQIIPPSDSLMLKGIANPIPIADKINRTIVFIVKGFLPIPNFNNYHFWNSNIFNAYPSALWGISIILFLVPGILFFRQVRAMIFFYAGCLGMAAFFFFIGFSGVRYYGMIYIIFVGASWLRLLSPNHSTQDNTLKTGPSLPQPASFKWTISLLFLIHTCTGLIAYTKDILHPFSESKEVAQYIKKNNLENLPIMTEPFNATGICAYFDKKFFIIQLSDWGTFCRWNIPSRSLTAEEVVQEALRKASKEKQVCLLIYSSPLENTGNNNRIALLKRFNKGIVRWENFYLYKIMP